MCIHCMIWCPFLFFKRCLLLHCICMYVWNKTWWVSFLLCHPHNNSVFFFHSFLFSSLHKHCYESPLMFLCSFWFLVLSNRVSEKPKTNLKLNVWSETILFRLFLFFFASFDCSLTSSCVLFQVKLVGEKKSKAKPKEKKKTSVIHTYVSVWCLLGSVRLFYFHIFYVHGCFDIKNFVMTHEIVDAEMENLKAPFKGIINDIRGRALCYKDDWTSGLYSGAG